MSVEDSALLDLAGKINTDFLSNEENGFTQLIQHEQMTFDELLQDFQDFLINTLFIERKNLVEAGDIDKLQDVAETAYQSLWNRRIGSNMTDVILVTLGISEPVNYIGAWIEQAMKKYNEAVDKLNHGDRSLWEKYTKEGWFDANGVPLERRKKRGPQFFGKPYPNPTSFFCNVLAWGTDVKGQQEILFQDALGGETDDKQVNLICPKCKKRSITTKCANCGEKKKFFDFEDIARSAFKRFQTIISIKRKTVKVEGRDKKVTEIKWTKQTTIPRKLEDVDLATVDRILTHSAVKERTVSAKDLERIYNEHIKDDGKPDRGHWVVLIGMVNDIAPFIDKKFRYSITISQKGMGFISSSGKAIAGVKVMIPEHVWVFMGGANISKFSNIAVIGNIERRESWTKQTGTIHGQYEPPELNAWGFKILDVDGGKPKNIVEDVSEGSVDVDISSEDEGSTSITFDSNNSFNPEPRSPAIPVPTPSVDAAQSGKGNAQRVPAQAPKPQADDDSDFF